MYNILLRFLGKIIKIKFKTGAQSRINSTGTKNSAVVGEPHFTDDTFVLYLFNGTVCLQSGMRFTSSTSAPTTTEIPNSGEFGIHKNTSGGNVYLAYNDGGVIKKVELT